MEPAFHYQSLLGGDPGIVETVAKVKQVIYYSLREPSQRVRKRAEKLLLFTPERNEPEETGAIFDWVQSHFHYLHDPHGIEYLKSPEVSDDEISRQGVFTGDCDDAVAYLGALLKSVGYPVTISIISPSQIKSFDYRHIFLKVFLSKQNRWMTLDPTAKGRRAGWEAPSKRGSDYDL